MLGVLGWKGRVSKHIACRDRSSFIEIRVVGQLLYDPALGTYYTGTRTLTPHP